MEREYRALICPVCKEFFFSELSEDEKKNGYNTNDFRCNVCGWKYNLSQVDNNLLVDEEGVSLEEAIESFKEKRAKDPKYNYLDYCCKNKKRRDTYVLFVGNINLKIKSHMIFVRIVDGKTMDILKVEEQTSTA